MKLWGVYIKQCKGRLLLEFRFRSHSFISSLVKKNLYNNAQDEPIECLHTLQLKPSKDPNVVTSNHSS